MGAHVCCNRHEIIENPIDHSNERWIKSRQSSSQRYLLQNDNPKLTYGRPGNRYDSNYLSPEDSYNFEIPI